MARLWEREEVWRYEGKQPKLHFGWQQLHLGLNAALKVLSWVSIAAYSLTVEDNAIWPGFSPSGSLV